MQAPNYLSLCTTSINFRKFELIFMNFCMYIMAREPTLNVYFINPSHQSLCLHVYSPLSLLGNGSVNTFPWQRRIVESVVFYAIHVL
jgi:hypothetical protein